MGIRYRKLEGHERIRLGKMTHPVRGFLHGSAAVVSLVGAALITVLTGGRIIVLSGASGRIHPADVLHFGVFRTWPPRDEVDLAVDFVNAEGPLDARGGLREGSFSRARLLEANGG